jgi:spermidine synthase
MKRRRLLGLTLGLPLFGGCDRASGTAGLPAPQVVARRRSPYGTLTVVDQGGRRYLTHDPQGSIATVQSSLDLARPESLASSYARLMMLAMAQAGQTRRVLQIGVGAGSMAGYVVRNWPQTRVDAVELDPVAIELGTEHFNLRADPRLAIHIADGRAWLAASAERFDVVMLDAYDHRTIPAALADASFFALVAEHLAAGGAVAQNAYRGGVDVAALRATMRRAFEQVDEYGLPENAVLLGYQGAPLAASALLARAKAIDAQVRPLHPLAELVAHRVERR